MPGDEDGNLDLEGADKTDLRLESLDFGPDSN